MSEHVLLSVDRLYVFWTLGLRGVSLENASSDIDKPCQWAWLQHVDIMNGSRLWVEDVYSRNCCFRSINGPQY
jgi:hypothetical protein